MITIIIVFISCLISVVPAQELAISPLNPTDFQGSSIIFTCVSQIGDVGAIQWLINGVLLQDPLMNNIINITRVSDAFSVLVISNVSDDITVQCTSTNPSSQSNIATLSVQGLLDVVNNLAVNYINEETAFNISWNAPFSLVILPVNVPDITYCITITNSSASDRFGITDTHYLFQQDFDPCIEYNVTITPVNEVGNGSSSQLSFPIPGGTITSQFCNAMALPNGTIKYQITLHDPVCSCEVIILSPRTTLSCSIDSSTISFNSETLPLNAKYNATVTLINARIAISSEITLDTFDTKDINITIASNALDICVSYIENTSARGVLVVLLHIIEGGGVDLSRSVYRVLERVELASENVFSNVPNGTYRVLAYDIENDGVLELGKTSPATSQRINIDGVDIAPISPPMVRCTVTLENSSVAVMCTLASQSVTEYLVILHFIDENILNVNRSKDVMSPVLFEASNNGSHHVIVFPIMEDDGIIGTSVLYSEMIEVMGVPPPPTTSPPPTNPPTTTPTTTNTITLGTQGPAPAGSMLTVTIIAVIVLLVIIILVFLLIVAFLCILILAKKRMKESSLNFPSASVAPPKDGELDDNVNYGVVNPNISHGVITTDGVVNTDSEVTPSVSYGEVTTDISNDTTVIPNVSYGVVNSHGTVTNGEATPNISYGVVNTDVSNGVVIPNVSYGAVTTNGAMIPNVSYGAVTTNGAMTSNVSYNVTIRSDVPAVIPMYEEILPVTSNYHQYELIDLEPNTQRAT